MMTTPERSEVKKVTLEELLRVKRAELPAPEFWSRFEQDLRAKQLAAIIEPRPWWVTLRLPQLARGVSRLQLPMGAAAVLVFGFMVVRSYGPLDTGSNGEVSLLTQQSADFASQVPPDNSEGITFRSADEKSDGTKEDSLSSIVSTASGRNPATDLIPRIAVLDSLPTGTGELLAMIPWAAPQQGAAAEPAASAFKLGELPKESFASAIKPASELEFASRVDVEPVVMTVAREDSRDPLEAPVQASPVSTREMRRNHILSSLVVANNGTDVARSRAVQDREVSDSLNDDRMYDSVRRVGMGGDRLTLKF